MKKVFTATAAVLFSLGLTFSAYAGQWKQGAGANAGKWWYMWSNGTYPAKTWEWIDGNQDGTAECYYFDQDGWLVVNKDIDGSHVNADGAWVIGGTVKTKPASEIPTENRNNTTAAKKSEGQNNNSSDSRWVQDGSAWKYREGNGFATEKWVKNNGNQYYLNEQSEMVTGFAEVDGLRYYFKPDGALQTKTFKADGIWYVVDENDHTVIDEVDESEWETYRSENNIKNIDWSAVLTSGYILNKDTDRNGYLSSHGVNDMKVVCAVLGVEDVSKDSLNQKEKAVYDVVKKFVSKKSLREMDDYEKVMEITKFIWKKASYKKTGTDCYTPYGALVKGKTVCEGYARSFKLLCNCLGITCYYMDGWFSHGGGHAWNGVMIDGEWYMIDTTESSSGFDEGLASAMLFNEEMVDRGFHFSYKFTSTFPNIRYYRQCDWSKYPAMDGTSYIDESYIVYND